MMNSELLWLGMAALMLILSSGAVEGINFTFNSFKRLSDVNTVVNGGQWSYSGSDSSLYLKPSINSVAGRFLYPYPVRMMDPKTMTANSFSCNFIFQIFIPDGNGSRTGSGMTFMMVPDNSTVGGALDYMGLLTDITTDSNLHTFGVEFDTHMNPEFNDPNDNHVGIDLRVMNSTATFIPPFRMAQRSREVYHQVWIEYFQAPDSRIDLYISQYGQGKPSMPFSTLVDLSFLNEYMYVGFSAAQSDNVHKILAWSFSTDGPAPPIWINTTDLAPSSSSPPISGLEPSASASPGGAVRLILGLVFGIVGIICFGIMFLCLRKHEIFSHPRRPVRFFLAHSAGEDYAGKNFAERLYRELKSTLRYRLDLISVFFDRGSLSLAEDFPKNINRELDRTDVGVVIVTEEFFQKQWPMTELLSLVRRKSMNDRVRILPLFYRLDVSEVKSRLRAGEWDEGWKEMSRLNVDECRAAVETLCRQYGIEYNASDRSRDSEYIEKILEAIAEISDAMWQQVI